tara:strand:+ start:1426 stop:1800 length:375 start_codon:yes stop_codon:yes gene_type:complete
MSAHSTLEYTRENALGFITRDELSKLKNKQLEYIMDVLLDENLYNCVIIDDDRVDEDEPMVTMTYREIFRRTDDRRSGESILNIMGVNPYYLNEGGDPTEVKDLTWSQVADIMVRNEFENRMFH